MERLHPMMKYGNFIEVYNNQRYMSMNCNKFTHDIDEILENPMMYFIRYVLLMETCLKRFITGIIYQYLNLSVVA